MVILVNKESNEKDIQRALIKLKEKSKKKKLSDFYGALPDTFGDGMEYQRKLRNDWD